MASQLKSLTEQQQEALQQFKQNVSDVLSPHDTDAILLKWLRARNYNATKAAVYYREMQNFRQVYELDSILETYTKPEIAEKYNYDAFLGFAKDGSIVRYVPVGRGDHFGFFKSLSGYDCILLFTYIIEQDLSLQRKENSRTGREVNEITYIFDFQGFSIQDIMHTCVFEMAFDLGRMVQDYFPEIWGNLLLINASVLFDVVFNIFKPIISHSVIQKLKIISKESQAETLLKYIDEDVLPVFLGGKRVDSEGNPRCAEFLRFGGKVPTNYYLCNAPLLSPTDPNVTSIWISPRCVYNHSLVVRRPGSKFRVEFRTERGSIDLRILYRKMETDPEKIDVPTVDEYLSERDENTNVELVSPPLRIQSHISPVNAKGKAPWPGIYIFRFDNIHSWFGYRLLLFRIEMIESDSDVVVESQNSNACAENVQETK